MKRKNENILANYDCKKCSIPNYSDVTNVRKNILKKDTVFAMD